nr:tetratricopeptide repeat protein [Pseudoalteromonas sp. S16_S37]
MLAERHNNTEQVQAKSKEGLALLEQQDAQLQQTLKADLYSLLSTSYRALADYGNALKYAKLALELSEGDLPKLARSHNQIGVIYDYSGNVELALKHHELSLNIRRQSDNQQGLSDSLYNIGEIYRDMGRLPQALKHFKQALKVDESLGNPYHIANSHGKLGQVYLAMGDIKRAQEHIEHGIYITNKMQAPSDAAWQMSNLARVYVAKGELYKAHEIANDALELAINAKAKRTEHTVRMALLDIAMAQKNTAEARTQIELLLSMPNTGLQYQQELHKINAQLYEESGDITEAYLALKRFVEVQKELYSYIEKRQSERVAQNVEVIRQEQALSLLQKEKALQQAQVDNLELQRKVVVLFMLLFLGVVLMFYFRQIAKQKMANLSAQMLATNLKEKNQLLSDVSHELRTPLAALKLSIELLEHNIEPDTEKAYGRVHSKIAQLDNLIGDIYRSAQYDNNVIQLQKQPADLSELLQDIVNDFKPQYQLKPQALVIDPLPEGLICEVDPERFKQIIINLLNNSLAYTYENGETHVSLQIIDCNGVNKAQLTVSDSEPGLSGAQLSKIFERFYRADSSRSRDLGGSGLGLAICKQIVLAHGGEIVAEQSELGGVTFKVLLNLS